MNWHVAAVAFRETLVVVLAFLGGRGVYKALRQEGTRRGALMVVGTIIVVALIVGLVRGLGLRVVMGGEAGT